MKYRIYIDETGNSDLRSSDDPNHRYLGLTGIIMDLGHVEKIVHPEMEALKKRYFFSHVDEPVIFHRKEMLNKKPPFHPLADTETEARFNDELLFLLARWEYTVISVLIDKKAHNDMYLTWKFDPYHYCLSVMLERFCFFLEGCNEVGDVMIESRGGKEDRRLKSSFSRLYQEGTEYISGDRFRKVFTSKELKVKPKANNISGLQLADMLAHPARRDILRREGVPQHSGRTLGDRIIAILRNKYYSRKGIVLGYGIKKLP